MRLTQIRVDAAIDDILGLALIKRTSDTLSIHRLQQKAFIEFEPRTLPLKTALERAASLLRYCYPYSDSVVSHYHETTECCLDRWHACAKYLPHALSLARIYEKEEKVISTLPASSDAIRLWTDCGWFLYGNEAFYEGEKLLEIAEHACDKNYGVEYSSICTHFAVLYYWLHEIKKAREKVGIALTLRSGYLAVASEERASVVDLCGMVYFSEGDYEAALQLFKDCATVYRILLEKKEVSVGYVSTNHLNISMAYLQMGDVDNATKALGTAEDLVEKKSSHLGSL